MSDTQHCTCTICRDFHWVSGQWRYKFVRYRRRRQRLTTLLAWLDKVKP